MMKLILLFFAFGLMTCCTSRPAPTSADECVARLKDNDVRLEKPLPGDWLYGHPEPGQTFEEYVNGNPVKADDLQNRIYLQPLGAFTQAQFTVIQRTAIYLQLFFDRQVKILPTIDDRIVPDSVKRNLGKKTEQLLTTPILDYLQNNRRQDGLIIMAMTSKDLYPGPSYNYVFGQARTKKRVGVSSIYRYSSASMDSTNHGECLERLIKTSSHEMCHMLSCEHCTNAVCVMNGSNSLAESDSRPNRLCSVCLKKIQWNLGFDIRTRLLGLNKYFEKHGLALDFKLSEQDLQALN